MEYFSNCAGAQGALSARVWQVCLHPLGRSPQPLPRGPAAGSGVHPESSHGRTAKAPG